MRTTARDDSGQRDSDQRDSDQRDSDQRDSDQRDSGTDGSRPPGSEGHARGRGDGRGPRVASAALEAVRGLTGKRAEAVTGLERTEEGWAVEVEVLELERIPSTTDVLATYRVSLDGDGELQGCRRVRRYLRGSPGDD
jgi:hypothetical protein